MDKIKIKINVIGQHMDLVFFFVHVFIYACVYFFYFCDGLFTYFGFRVNFFFSNQHLDMKER